MMGLFGEQTYKIVEVLPKRYLQLKVSTMEDGDYGYMESSTILIDENMHGFVPVGKAVYESSPNDGYKYFFVRKENGRLIVRLPKKHIFHTIMNVAEMHRDLFARVDFEVPV